MPNEIDNPITGAQPPDRRMFNRRGTLFGVLLRVTRDPELAYTAYTEVMDMAGAHVLAEVRILAVKLEALTGLVRGLAARLRELEERVTAIEKRLDIRMTESEKRLDIRMTESEKRLDIRMTESEKRLDERIKASEAATTARLDKVDARLDKVDARLDRIGDQVKETRDVLLAKIDADNASHRRMLYGMIVMLMAVVLGTVLR